MLIVAASAAAVLVPPFARFGERLIGQARRAEPGVDQQRRDRHRQNRDNGSHQRLRADRGQGFAIVERENAATDFGARRFGLFGGQQTACQIALDLGKLVAVDRQIIRLARPRLVLARQ